MGKGGRGKTSSAASTAAAEDDDKLLAAAIAENKKAAKEQQQQQQQKQKQKPAVGGGASSSSELPKKGLTANEIVEKLNVVPCFCLLNGDKNLVGLKDPNDPTGQLELCVWFADPREAKATLDVCKVENPSLSETLHLGVTPLGIAYAFACGWAECHFFGEKHVRGSAEALAGGQDPIPLLCEQAASQGLDPQPWHVPVFTCDELSTPSRMPIFMSRKAFAESWVTSGRKLSEIPSNVAVIDLGVLVHQMQQDVFAWSTIQFVCERKAVQLVNESKQASVAARSAGASAASSQDDAAPPPLA
jgi:hypothetical protein